MILTVKRRIKFSAGHRLLGHGGKCENLHGHNYCVEFHVAARWTPSAAWWISAI